MPHGLMKYLQISRLRSHPHHVESVARQFSQSLKRDMRIFWKTAICTKQFYIFQMQNFGTFFSESKRYEKMTKVHNLFIIGLATQNPVYYNFLPWFIAWVNADSSPNPITLVLAPFSISNWAISSNSEKRMYMHKCVRKVSVMLII